MPRTAASRRAQTAKLKAAALAALCSCGGSNLVVLEILRLREDGAPSGLALPSASDPADPPQRDPLSGMECRVPGHKRELLIVEVVREVLDADQARPQARIASVRQGDETALSFGRDSSVSEGRFEPSAVDPAPRAPRPSMPEPQPMPPRAPEPVFAPSPTLSFFCPEESPAAFRTLELTAMVCPVAGCGHDRGMHVGSGPSFGGRCMETFCRCDGYRPTSTASHHKEP